MKQVCLFEIFYILTYKIDILAKYRHLIKHYGTGKDSYYYFRIPDKTIKGGAFRKKKKTKEEIESALCDYFIEKEKQNSIGKDTATFEQLFYEFMKHKKEKVSAGTIRRMSFDWKKYYKTNPEFIQKPYKDVTPIDIDDFLNNIVNTTASRIAGHADERTTIKNYLFDTNNEEKAKKAILNALEDNPESSVTTTYRNVENEKRL